MERTLVMLWVATVGYLLPNIVSGYLPVVFPQETWPLCYIGDDQLHQGTCERLVDCTEAVQAVYRGQHPPSCYWRRHHTFPLVCCPRLVAYDTILEPNTVITIPVHQSEKQEDCGRLSGSPQDNVWPWMVTIYEDLDGKNPVSSGFLIDDKHVLTSAQTFPSKKESQSWTVRIERPKRDSSETSEALLAVKDVKVHEGFRSWVRYDDLALLTLDLPVQDAQPLCLASREVDPNALAGVNVTVLGAHRTDQVPVVSPTWCSEMYSKFLPLSYPRGLGDQFFCAGLQLQNQPLAPGVDDQGGPVMTQTSDGSWMAVGLVSLDYKCTQQGLPGVYLNLAHYKDWIEEQRAVPE